MNESVIVDIARDGIWTLLMICGPTLLVALGVGVLVSLVQTLTHIQEMTLTFVPKILAMFLSILFFLPFMIRQIDEFWLRMMDSVVNLE
ncbi:MAG: flagellar biosynthesis protein FliQ [Caenispirillum bisanense]|uniref:Flagellar biosynthetic protein FliQ n=1 Tax=Caenispirillum bisanense TaxID=414052 RepID=A0A286G275_9PROT|nr:flagellar biosynthesis protein FliQ [Caenispirillum bisanense]MCA1941166.1 flagellar biosynthesis protein FliQ [Caenispirillum bisanense]MCA1973845.1 flagellar biosynthesis protein FliQ [Caenispirillum sp.]SOD89084.1 flagellar biosynthetic protein FliQ [Caenispirillum bisanense]